MGVVPCAVGGVGGEVAQVVPAELEEGGAHGGGAAGSGRGEAVGLVFMVPGEGVGQGGEEGCEGGGEEGQQKNEAVE